MRKSEQLLRDIAEVRRFNQIEQLLNFMIDERSESAPWLLVPETAGVIACTKILSPPFVNGRNFQSIHFSNTDKFKVHVNKGTIGQYYCGRAPFSTGEKPHYALGTGYEIKDVTEMIRQVG